MLPHLPGKGLGCIHIAVGLHSNRTRLLTSRTAGIALLAICYQRYTRNTWHDTICRRANTASHGCLLMVQLLLCVYLRLQS